MKICHMCEREKSASVNFKIVRDRQGLTSLRISGFFRFKHNIKNSSASIAPMLGDLEKT